MSSHTTAEQQAIWHAKNPGKRREYDAREYAKHKEEIVERVAIWRKNNPEKAAAARARHREKHREHRKAVASEYREKNKLKIKERNRMRYLRDKQKIASINRAWRIKNPEKYEAIKKAAGVYTMRRFYSDPNFRLAATIRNRIKDFVTSAKGNRRCKSLDLLGASIIEVRIHLESKFKPEMTWENYGYKGWHIDHILPCSAFDLTNPEDQKECFHYTNLQPLWWWENLSKGNEL